MQQTGFLILLLPILRDYTRAYLIRICSEGNYGCQLTVFESFVCAYRAQTSYRLREVILREAQKIVSIENMYCKRLHVSGRFVDSIGTATKPRIGHHTVTIISNVLRKLVVWTAKGNRMATLSRVTPIRVVGINLFTILRLQWTRLRIINRPITRRDKRWISQRRYWAHLLWIVGHLW